MRIIWSPWRSGNPACRSARSFQCRSDLGGRALPEPHQPGVHLLALRRYPAMHPLSFRPFDASM
jgi:hypothetical protein